MREAGEPSTEEVATVLSKALCPPHRGRHGLTTDDPAQRFKGAKRRPRQGRVPEMRGQGHYRGRSPKAPARPEVLEEPQ
jgi:hypothetical protein